MGTNLKQDVMICSHYEQYTSQLMGPTLILAIIVFCRPEIIVNRWFQVIQCKTNRAVEYLHFVKNEIWIDNQENTQGGTRRCFNGVFLSKKCRNVDNVIWTLCQRCFTNVISTSISQHCIIITNWSSQRAQQFLSLKNSFWQGTTPLHYFLEGIN